MDISRENVALIGRFGRTVAQSSDMSSVALEALKLTRKLAAATELRVVNASAGRWKEWHASGRRVRESETLEWPSPSPAARTVRFETSGEQYGFVSVSPDTEEAEWVLEFMAPHIAAALTLFAAIRQAQKSAVSEAELVRAALRAREEERRRITHELHDDVGQTIAALKLKVKLVQDRIRKNGSGRNAADELDEVREGIGSLLSRIRDLSHTLYPRILDTLGLVPALRNLSEQVSDPAGIRIRCEVQGELRPLEENIAVALYRCCQESLSNAIRHSGASSVTIRILFAPSEVLVIVEDDGGGFDPRRYYDSAGKLMSSGFWTIRQRMSDVGGSFRIGTATGRGTSIGMVVPTTTKEEDKQNGNDNRKN